MKQLPTKKRLNRPICRKCVNQAYIEEIPFCKKIAPNIGNFGACMDFEERKEEQINEQISIFD